MFTVKSTLAKTLVLDLTDIPFDDLEGPVRFEMSHEGASCIRQIRLAMMNDHINKWLRTERNLQPIEYLVKVYEWHGWPIHVTFVPKQ